MSYQVLARKWRPRRFADMVGQEHVLKALINALDNDRLHHAYLFTGTRGVGKTTVARIFAKCLNCEQGVSANPCGTCAACVEVDEGRFIDLIEVDAASRTKVEDTRELLENVQYAPTRGRYKIYLIDEVHMLSTNSFNALLKTLEEPPPHVKFLLATTDPQKLPVTILSRCLQFSLKNMLPERIVGHLKHVLSEENIAFEEPALWQLARSADGSMRDALSLTDQAIAFGNGQLIETDVRNMLGTIDRVYTYRLLEAIANHDAQTVLDVVSELSDYSPDYASILADLLSLLHRIAIEQQVAGAIDNSEGDQVQVAQFAQQMLREDVQLFYQIALNGRRDIFITPDARMGFEMTLLRMIAFKPVTFDDSSAGKTNAAGAMAQKKSDVKSTHSNRPIPVAAQPNNVVAMRSGAQPARVVEPTSMPAIDPAPVSAPTLRVVKAHSGALPELEQMTNAAWMQLFDELAVDGVAQTLLSHCVWIDSSAKQITLHLKKEYAGILNDMQYARMADAFSQHLGRDIHLVVTPQELADETPAAYKVRIDAEKHARAVTSLEQDPFVQSLIQAFDAQLQADTVISLEKPTER